jgi:exodeoxyribonuclease X
MPGVIWLDTLRIAKQYIPDAEQFTNQYLRYYLKLDVAEARGIPAHRALADAMVTAELFRHLINGPAKEHFDLLGVVEFAKRMEDPVLVKTVGFGKHRGKLWSEVKTDYLMWLVRNATDLDKDTMFTVRHQLELR